MFSNDCGLHYFFKALSFKHNRFNNKTENNKMLKSILCFLFLECVLYVHNTHISALPASYTEQMVLMPAQKLNLQLNP